MSAAVNFSVSRSQASGGGGGGGNDADGGKKNNASNTSAKDKGGHTNSTSTLLLPHDFLTACLGRRVTVLLCHQHNELEGQLVSVNSDDGSILLTDMVHYVSTYEKGEYASVKANSKQPPNAENKKAQESPRGQHALVHREEVRRCDKAIVNSKYIELISLATGVQ